jgi:hypothetical protein
MRRAILFSVLTLMAICALTPAAAVAQTQSINGIGLVDYYRTPDFKPGDWVKYRVSSTSELGAADDYELILVIAGEEEWWGEKCFWLETVSQAIDGPPTSVAALMSYDVFKDSLALTNSRYYVRKQISSMNEQGEPVVELVRRPVSSFRTRQTNQRKLEWYIDTLEVATREAAMGSFTCQKLLFKQAAGGSIDIGDSSRYEEVREDRTIWRNLDIPITSIVLEEIEKVVERKTWVQGKSADAPTITRDSVYGTAEVVGWGSGRKSEIIPEHLQRSLAEQRAKARKSSG